MDTDHDGSISLREFKSAHKQLNVLFPGSDWEQVYKSIDLNRDGVVDMDEFITATANHSKMANKQNIKKIFNMFDTNGDGVIDIKEFFAVLPKDQEVIQHDIHESETKLREKNITPNGPGNSYTGDINRNDQDRWKDFIKNIDKNNDDMICFEEFQDALYQFADDAFDEIAVE